MSKVYNVVVSSKNRKTQDTNSSMLIKFKEDIFVENDEELYICMSSFYTLKSFYACQTGLNDHFQVIFRFPNENENIEVFDIYLPEGNYNVASLKDEIKRQTNQLFEIEYYSKTNKFLFKNMFQPIYDVFLKPINAGIFLGFSDGIEHAIFRPDPEQGILGTYSSKFINISGYTSLIIKIEGDVSVENTISNIDDIDFKYDKILGILSINDIAPMDSIRYEDTNGCMFRHKINNNKIPSFKIKIVNEDGVEFPQMADWIMMLKFEVIQQDNKMSKMEMLLENINYMMMRIYAYMEIPTTITLDDVLNR